MEIKLEYLKYYVCDCFPILKISIGPANFSSTTISLFRNVFRKFFANNTRVSFVHLRGCEAPTGRSLISIQGPPSKSGTQTFGWCLSNQIFPRCLNVDKTTPDPSLHGYLPLNDCSCPTSTTSMGKWNSFTVIARFDPNLNRSEGNTFFTPCLCILMNHCWCQPISALSFHVIFEVLQLDFHFYRRKMLVQLTASSNGNYES